MISTNRVHARLTRVFPRPIKTHCSPDGALVAFTVSEPDGHEEIYVVNVEGGRMRRLTRAGADFARVATWSEDGEVVYFVTSASRAFRPSVQRCARRLPGATRPCLTSERRARRLGLRGADWEAAPRRLGCCLLLGQLNRCVAVLGTGAASRIYAQLRPLRNVRALLPPSGSSGGARAPQNSVQSAAARAAPREGSGGGADECLDWWLRFSTGKTRGQLLASVLPGR